MNSEKYSDNEKNAEPVIVIPKSGYLYQYAVAFSATLILSSGALAYGWTSPAIPKLVADDSPIPITADESSWLVAYFVLSSIVAPLPTAWMMDRFGRKITLLSSAIPLLIGWILVGVAKSVPILYVARIFSGFTYGMIYSVTPMYLGEIASDAIRGSIGTLLTVMAKAGILYVYVIGPYVSFKLMAWLAMIPPILFLCTFIWCPESPYFLLGKSRDDAAYKSLSKFRGHKNVHDELKQMSIAVKKSQENRGTIKELFTAGNRRSLIIILGLGAAQQLCGSQAVIAYSHRIFEEVGSTLGASDASIVLGVIQLVTAAFSSSIVDRLGRRPLLLISTSGAAICNTIVGLYFLLDRYIDVSGISWLPLTALMAFIVCYTIGLATVPFAIIGEVFPKNVKAIAGASFAIFSGSISFGVAKLFQIVSDDLGSDYTFLGFAIFTFFFFGFVYYRIPETKGKPLDVILEDMKLFKRKNVKK